MTVAEIFGVGGFGRGEDGGGEGESVVDEGGLGLGAKKREMTCCFCFPMFVVVAPPWYRGSAGGGFADLRGFGALWVFSGKCWNFWTFFCFPPLILMLYLYTSHKKLHI